MTEFSQHAIEALRNADASSIPDDANFVLEQRITADGEVLDQYYVTISGGAIEVQPGAADAPDVIMTQDRATAVALRAGKLHAQEAFLTGRLSLDGDIDRLLAFGPVLSTLLDVSGPDT